MQPETTHHALSEHMRACLAAFGDASEALGTAINREILATAPATLDAIGKMLKAGGRLELVFGIGAVPTVAVVGEFQGKRETVVEFAVPRTVN